ncbi:MAG: hypothetical protein R3266_06615, partial [Gemmatimonadota bacterium]|nr:hypothetical protein [Gemmatimonadota bacterium]
KTILQFNVAGDQIVPFGQSIALPANFDGTAIDFIQDLFVTTTSAFGGSQIIFGALSTGEQVTTTFPGATGPLADAGKPSLVVDATGTVGALVPARAEDAAYIAFPGQATAQRVATEIGTFVERVLPFGAFILAVDANLDDEGDFSPLGPPRLALHNFTTGEFFDEVQLDGTVNATDALILDDNVAFLAGGGFTPTFEPAGDGAIAVINVTTRGIRDILPLGGNGLSIEAGRDGLGYIVRTQGSFETTDVLTFNFSTQAFERGPSNPIQPLDADGSNLNCRVVTALATRELLCATFEATAQGRLVLLTQDGTFLDEAAIGAGVTDIALR